MSGLMAHWYAKRLSKKLAILSCSLGSSILQIHRVSNDANGPSVHRLALNANILHQLVSDNDNRYRCIVNPYKNKVIVKFAILQNRSDGPVLTLGGNGGFQWIGRVSELGSNLVILSMLIENNCSTPALATLLSNLQIDDNPVYPSGIARTKT